MASKKKKLATNHKVTIEWNSMVKESYEQEARNRTDKERSFFSFMKNTALHNTAIFTGQITH